MVWSNNPFSYQKSVYIAFAQTVFLTILHSWKIRLSVTSYTHCSVKKAILMHFSALLHRLFSKDAEIPLKAPQSSSRSSTFLFDHWPGSRESWCQQRLVRQRQTILFVFSVSHWQAFPSTMTGAGSWRRLWSIHPEGRRLAEHFPAGSHPFTLSEPCSGARPTVEGYSRDLALAYSE